MLILILFFCSGATALIYEVIWSKYLALLFGSTIQAQTVVLAVFMGGLAVGNRLFGRWADQARQPLAIYGYVEAAIGLYAFFFPTIYKLADHVFVALGSGILGRTGWLLSLKGALSVGLLLGPTILMGGTLPLIAAWLQKTTPDAGRRSARFYSTNSLGAVCGAGLAGFLLVESLGMPASLQMAALVNVIIGFIALGIARMRGPLAVSGKPESSGNAVAEAGTGSPVFRWGCWLVALTGGVSMGLEVLASRCLSLIFGASLQAFAIVLMAFILGIGIGAAVIASPRRKHWPKEITTIAMLLVAAGLIGLVVFNIEQLVEIYRYARSGLGRTAMGYRYHQTLAALMSVAVLGLPAAALGSVLPLWIRVVSESSDLLGDRVGRLLTWNTMGAVGGVLLTGFVLMPTIGLRGSFGALAVLLSASAMLIAWLVRKRFAALVCGAATGLLVLDCATGGEGWRHTLSSGVFRKHETEVYRDAMKDRRRDVKILFYEDAADATVSVEQGDIGVGGDKIKLRINGKVDASSHGDLSTQYLLAHLPLMMRPESKEVFVFGMGSGITAGAMLGHPVDHVTVAENCAPVLRAVDFFKPWNHNLLADNRTRIFREDARTVLKLGAQKYDVIISEPSNPWMVGVGSVFSREFYQMAAARLNEGGIMAQWFHVYEMHDGIIELVLRTFGTVFPHMEIWDASEGDVIILGSDRPWKSDPEVYRRALEREMPRRELERIGLGTVEAIWARQLASQRTGFAVVGDGPIQLDDFPVLEYAAPRAFFVGQGARRIFQFDERTWQSGISATAKNGALAGLSDQNLKDIFGGEYASVNRDLQDYLRMRFAGNDLNYFLAGTPMPCAFRKPNPLAAPVTAVTTNGLQQSWVEGEGLLQNEPAKQIEGVRIIESLLNDTASARACWAPAYYAALAVKASLRLGNANQSSAILLNALKLVPDSDQLQYLARIMTREGIIRPEETQGGRSP